MLSYDKIDMLICIIYFKVEKLITEVPEWTPRIEPTASFGPSPRYSGGDNFIFSLLISLYLTFEFL